MKRIASRVLVLVVGMLSALSIAQDETYRLQPEDVVRIRVYNETQVNEELEIDPSGNLSAPFVGIVKAKGKTTSELEIELKELYTKKLRLRDPVVSVTIARYRVRRATVGGFVRQAGNYIFRPGETILTLLNQAGGPIFGQADLRKATLRRAGSDEKIPVDIEAILGGDTSQNYVLEDGDELLVPEDRKNRVVVWGAVQQPGNVPFTDGMRLAEALAFARGEIRTQSKFSEVMVLRKGPGNKDIAIKSNMVRFYKNQDFAQNLLLQRGDIVFVPSTKTPSVGEIGSILNAAFFADRIFQEGLFGFRPLSFLGR